MLLVVFTIEIYYDARPYERQGRSESKHNDLLVYICTAIQR